MKLCFTYVSRSNMLWSVPAAIPAALVATALCTSPTSAQQDSVYEESRPAMGTTVDLLIYAAGPEEASQLFELAFQEIERVEAALSSYRPTSEISRINAAADQGPVTTDPEVFRLLERALEHSRLTDGAFDITVAPLVEVWGFSGGQGEWPRDESLQAAREKVGWTYVQLDAVNRSIRFSHPDVELDLGAIGKGYALDRAATVLRGQGVQSALLGAGQSSFLAIGVPPGKQGWTIRVTDPDNPDRALSSVVLGDRALSTSGSDQKFFERGGRRYSHIIDPRTGEPVVGMRQVTVLAETAADADALSTGLFVSGTVQAWELVRKVDGVSALMVANRIAAIEWPSEVSTTETRP
jgi:thiamine biosynthesis lipoprotein